MINKKHRKQAASWIFGAILVVPLLLFFYGTWYYEIFSPCQTQKEKKDKAQSDATKTKAASGIAPDKNETTTTGNQTGERDKVSPCSKPGEFVRDTWHDPVALFTGVLAYFVLLQFAWLYRQEWWARTHERAYVFGGGPFGLPKDKETAQRLKDGMEWNRASLFSDPRRMTIYNYGRTPAFITKIEWGLCDPAELPKTLSVSDAINEGRVSYEVVTTTSDVYPPAGHGEAYYLSRHVQFPRDANIGKIFFGRIWYRDVFREQHYSTFKLRLTEEFSDPWGDSYTDDWD